MNIRSLQGPASKVLEVQKLDRKKDVKTDSSHKDRDASTQEESQKNPKRKPMTDDEFKQALEKLADLAGVKANNLTVKFETRADMRIVIVEDPSGQVVRRIPELDLWSLLEDVDKAKGQIFDKAM
jgi:uncharacterized FlaG/YvyC family protein